MYYLTAPLLPLHVGTSINNSRILAKWELGISSGVTAVSSGPTMVIEYRTSAASSNGALVFSHHYYITGGVVNYLLYTWQI